MGVLLKLLTLPVTGPLNGTRWVAEQVLAAAQREYHDEAAIRRQISETEDRHALGKIDDAEYERRVDALLERLMEARSQSAATMDQGGTRG